MRRNSCLDMLDFFSSHLEEDKEKLARFIGIAEEDLGQNLELYELFGIEVKPESEMEDSPSKMKDLETKAIIEEEEQAEED
jgi:hypothetical protein